MTNVRKPPSLPLFGIVQEEQMFSKLFNLHSLNTQILTLTEDKIQELLKNECDVTIVFLYSYSIFYDKDIAKFEKSKHITVFMIKIFQSSTRMTKTCLLMLNLHFFPRVTK